MVDTLSIENYRGTNEIPVSESMDKLTVQFALVFITYGVAYASMWALYKFVLLPLGGFAMATVNPLIWGFNFLVGTGLPQHHLSEPVGHPAGRSHAADAGLRGPQHDASVCLLRHSHSAVSGDICVPVQGPPPEKINTDLFHRKPPSGGFRCFFENRKKAFVNA